MRKERIEEKANPKPKAPRVSADKVKERVYNAIVDMKEKDIPKAEALAVHKISPRQYERYSPIVRKSIT
jgi:hypothetical protein